MVQKAQSTGSKRKIYILKLANCYKHLTKKCLKGKNYLYFHLPL